MRINRQHTLLFAALTGAIAFGSLQAGTKRRGAASPTAASAIAPTVKVFLRNAGNSCYMNATMQCVLSNPSHRYQLNKVKDRPGFDAPWLQSIFGLVDDCLSPAAQDTVIDTKTCAKLVDQMMDPRSKVKMQQHDAAEFYSRLSEAIFGPLRREDPRTKLNTAQICPKCRKEAAIIPGATHAYISLPLAYQDPFKPGILPVSATSIRQLLKRYTTRNEAATPITDRLACDCNAMVVLNVPKVEAKAFLVINLERQIAGDHGQLTIHTPININKKLSLNGKEYCLTGVVFHSGGSTETGSTFGHYTAVTRTVERGSTDEDFTLRSAWTYYNDSRFSDGTKMFPSLNDKKSPHLSMAEQVSHGLNAKLLFYQQCE